MLCLRLFNEDLNMTSGRIYPRTPIVKRAKIGRQVYHLVDLPLRLELIDCA